VHGGRVRIAVAVGEGQVVIEVSDDGCGGTLRVLSTATTGTRVRAGNPCA
jgi:hypothetical protein